MLAGLHGETQKHSDGTMSEETAQFAIGGKVRKVTQAIRKIEKKQDATNDGTAVPVWYVGRITIVAATSRSGR